MIYVCEISGWNQNSQHFKKKFKLQEKTLQIINFQPPTATSNYLFLEPKILKIADFIRHRYAIVCPKLSKKESVPLFNGMFTTMNHNHNHIIRGSGKTHSQYTPRKKTLTLEITLLDQLPLKSGIIFTSFRIAIFKPAKILNSKTRYNRSAIKNNCLSLSF